MAEYNYTADIGVDLSQFQTELARAEKALGTLQGEAGSTSSYFEEMGTTLQELAGAEIFGEIEKGFAQGGQAALKAADDLQYYRQLVEEIRREVNLLASESTESALKLTPQQQDSRKAQKEEERELNRLIAEEEKQHAAEVAADRERYAAMWRQHLEQQEAQQKELAAEDKRAHDAAVANAQELQAIEDKVAEERIAAKRRDTEELYKMVDDQEKAFESYSGNIFQSQVNEIKEMSPALREAEQGTQQYREAMRQLNQEQEQWVEGLSNTRYAMFDVSRVMGMVSAATLGMATAGIAASASFERSFAEAERTILGTREEMQELQNQLTDMSTRMPASFDDIAGVAALGGQLNIAGENIEDFTETVIQFASTTDVSVDQAAEALGRLTQLSGAPQSEISNLGSAIYDVGTNSVATEGAIISIAEEIATAGRLAGFTAEETIGLAGALASLGIQPQAARGSIQRIFQDITLAVGEGGQELEKFAAVSQMSADQFAATWQDTPQAAFTALIEGLGRVNDAGGNVAQTLMDIGVTGTRDIQVMASLAANTDVYASTLATAGQAYAENTALAEGYDLISQTLVERLTILWNTLKAVVAQGFEPLMRALGPGITLLQNLADIMMRVTQHPVGAVFTSVAGGIMVMIGALALGVAGFARFYASVYGLITGLRGYVRSMEQATGGKTRMGLATRNLAAQLANLNPRIARATSGFFGLAQATNSTSGAMYTAAAGTRVLTGALRGLMSVTLIGAAIAALGWGVGKLAEKFDTASAASNSFMRDTQGLANAIRQDTLAVEDGADAFSTYSREVEESSDRLAPWANELSDASGAQVDLNEVTTETTESIRKQKVALGEATEAFIAHQLATDEAFQEFFRDNAETMREAGVDLQEAIRAALSSEDGGAGYFQGLIDEAREAGAEITRQMNEAMEAGDVGRAEQLHEQTLVINEQIRSLQSLKDMFSGTDEAIANATNQVDTFNAVNEAMGGILSENELGLEGMTEAAENYADGLFDSINAVIAMDEALIDLHESFYEHGNSLDIMTDEGTANMQALERAVTTLASNTEGDLAAWGEGLAGIFAHLEFAGADLGDEVDFLRLRMIEAFDRQYGIDLDISAAMGSIHDFIQAAIDAVEARAVLEREWQAQQASIQSSRERPSFYSAAAESFRGTPSQLPMLNDQLTQLRNLQSSLQDVGNTGSRVGDQIARGFDRAGDGADRAGRDARNAGDNAKDAQQEFRTLVDYASDLDSVWNRAFDIRFGVSMARDNSAEALQAIKDRAEEAAEAIRDSRQRVRELRAELQTLAADRSIMEYHLSVAVEYGDDLRAAALRAELAENNAEAASTSNELSDEQKNLKKAQDDATTSLTGNTEGARANRAEVQNLIQAYQAEIIALANSGASTDQLNARTAQLRAEFVRQLTQMGYNRNEVDRYARAFDDLTTVINNVPRNITVRANTDPAQQALNEFVARNRNRNIPMRVSTSGLPRSVSGGTYRPTNMAVGSGGTTTPTLVVTRHIGSGAGVPGGGGGHPEMRASGGPIYRAGGGGFPGRPKGTDTVPVWATPGEFMQRKKAVDYYGLPFMNAINNLQLPKYLYSGGPVAGGSGGGSGVRVQAVELLPHQMRQLADMVSVNVTLGDRQIAGASNSSNVRDSHRGRN